MPADIPDWSTVPAVPMLVTPGDPQPYTALAVQAYSFVFPIPTGAQSTRFHVVYGAGIAIANWQLIGNVSGLTFAYWTLPNQTFAGGALADHTSRVHAIDTTMTLSFNVTAQTGNAISFLADASILAGDIAVELVGNQGVVSTQPFTVQAIQATPWQFSNSSLDVAVALAAGGTTTAIGAVAGQRIYMGGVSVGFDAVAGGSDLVLRDGVGGTGRGRISASTLNPPAQDWRGRPLSTGNALELFADGAALTLRGIIPFSQAS